MTGSFVKLGFERLERRDNPDGDNWWYDSTIGNILSVPVQGAANIANGVQDIGIGLANLPAVVYNNTAGNLGGGAIGYIESPDWSRDLLSRTISCMVPVSSWAATAWSLRLPLVRVH